MQETCFAVCFCARVHFEWFIFARWQFYLESQFFIILISCQQSWIQPLTLVKHAMNVPSRHMVNVLGQITWCLFSIKQCTHLIDYTEIAGLLNCISPWTYWDLLQSSENLVFSFPLFLSPLLKNCCLKVFSKFSWFKPVAMTIVHILVCSPEFLTDLSLSWHRKIFRSCFRTVI